MWILTQDGNAFNSAHIVSLCTWYEGDEDYQVRADLDVMTTVPYATDALGETPSYIAQEPMQVTLAGGMQKAEASNLLEKLLLVNPNERVVKIADLLSARST